MVQIWSRYPQSAVTYGLLQSHPVVNRRRYLQAGYLLYPEYESVYCDDDVTLLAKMHGVQVTLKPCSLLNMRN